MVQGMLALRKKVRERERREEKQTDRQPDIDKETENRKYMTGEHYRNEKQNKTHLE